MRIHVAELRRHPGQSESFSLQQELAPLTLAGETITFIEPVRVSGKVTSGRAVLSVVGRVEARVRRECSRCLAPFAEKVVAPLEEEFVPSSQAALLDEKAKEQARLFAGEEIDLKEAVTEALVLALPMKALCRPDCPGLCPYCGRELKEGPCACAVEPKDERLAALKDLWAARPEARQEED